MIVIVVFPFVIGIFAAIAIPAFHDYTVRAKVAGAFYEGSRLKADAAAEIRGHQQKAAPSPGFQEINRLVDSSSPYVKSLVINYEASAILINLQADKFRTTGIENGAQIALTLDGKGAWTCSGVGIDPKFLPLDCRN